MSPLTLAQAALRDRPAGRPVMRQSWRHLLFLHFPCDPGEVARLLPPGLSVDTFPDETGEPKAWIGLVPFLMTNVRWSFSPAIPGTHTFPETNVRTYVHRDGKEPGVWFFSLDAMNRLAVLAARQAFSLPYFFSRMTLDVAGDYVRYTGDRAGARYAIDARIGPELADPAPGSLEFFLIERYLLYAFRNGKLWTGRVHHPPYRLRTAHAESLEEDLVSAAGLDARPFTHALFSPGVDVDIFPIIRT